jgi:peptide/nickel transport system ATP-binding protein
MCDRVGVLYAGRLVAEGKAEDVFTNPMHPYTVGLLRCLPTGQTSRARAKLDTIPGFLPPLGADIAGCVYADRCGIAQDICHTVPPPRQILEGDRQSLCHFPEQSQGMPRTVAPDPAARRTDEALLLEIKGASKTFQQDGHPVFALADVDLSIRSGETVGLVGESGSGKSTLARLILGIHSPDEGSVVELGGEALGERVTDRAVEQVRAIQMVFQDPDSALNRRHSVRRIVSRAVERLLDLGRKEVAARTRRLITEVRMGEQHLSSKPRHLSGGLKQRVAVARAFAGSPKLVVCDEPTSALDVSVQAAIINLLADLQAEEGVAYLFISHDLSVVRYLADRVAVMYLGRLMEVGTGERVFGGPHHPYTEALLSAAPSVEGETRVRIRLTGEIPSPSNPPSGCVFHTRCHRFIPGTCDVTEPPLVEAEPGYQLRCHIPVAELGALQRAEASDAAATG